MALEESIHDAMARIRNQLENLPTLIERERKIYSQAPKEGSPGYSNTNGETPKEEISPALEPGVHFVQDLESNGVKLERAKVDGVPGYRYKASEEEVLFLKDLGGGRVRYER